MHEHPEPVGSVTLPTYADLGPLMSVSDVAAYFGVTKSLAAQWTRGGDWPEPIAKLSSGAVYATGAVIAWGKAHERSRGGGPREAGDPTLPSRRGAARRELTG